MPVAITVLSSWPLLGSVVGFILIVGIDSRSIIIIIVGIGSGLIIIIVVFSVDHH